MRLLPLVAALAALALAGPVAAPPAEHAVAIRDFAFVPQQLQVRVGDTVVWTNEDAAPHSIIPFFAPWNSDDLQQ
ncbi:MAG TPA: hypothetical protein VGR28_06330, partial [Candidatus Thermoplasmatota archaeon]|nr:hypothetical protein [Candidatus Thermoplasmatota archaeon]